MLVAVRIGQLPAIVLMAVGSFVITTSTWAQPRGPASGTATPAAPVKFLVLNRGWVKTPDGSFGSTFDRASSKLQYTFRF